MFMLTLVLDFCVENVMFVKRTERLSVYSWTCSFDITYVS